MPKTVYEGEDDDLQPIAVFHLNTRPTKGGGGCVEPPCRCPHCGSCARGDDEDNGSLVVRSGVWRSKTTSSFFIARHWKLGRLAVNLGTFYTELQAAEAAIRLGKRACVIFEAAAGEIVHTIYNWPGDLRGNKYVSMQCQYSECTGTLCKRIGVLGKRIGVPKTLRPNRGGVRQRGGSLVCRATTAVRAAMASSLHRTAAYHTSPLPMSVARPR
jgi:hypothetical protein